MAPVAAPAFRAGLGRLMPEGYLRIGPLAAIPHILTQAGCDSAALMAQAGVPPDAFAHPDNAIPFPTVCRFAAACARALGREDFGLLISETISTSNLGLIGFLMKQASSVRAALEDLVRYFHHHDSGAVPFLRAQNDVVMLGYAILDASTPGSEIVSDGAIAIACNIMRALCGPQWAPIEITLSRRLPVAPARYERHFGVPVRFDAEHSAILFPARWLNQPIPAADPALRDMLQEQIRLMEETGGQTLSEKVRRLMRAALLAERGSMERVAGALKMSKRTLERRLVEEGSSFRKLSDEIHYEIARHLLENTAMPITEIGLALKFSEASAFSRAFKKWSGLPPRDWRTRAARAALDAPAA